jgi:hypothetical protein
VVVYLHKRMQVRTLLRVDLGEAAGLSQRQTEGTRKQPGANEIRVGMNRQENYFRRAL